MDNAEHLLPALASKLKTTANRRAIADRGWSHRGERVQVEGERSLPCSCSGDERGGGCCSWRRSRSVGARHRRWAGRARSCSALDNLPLALDVGRGARDRLLAAQHTRAGWGNDSISSRAGVTPTRGSRRCGPRSTGRISAGRPRAARVPSGSASSRAGARSKLRRMSPARPGHTPVLLDQEPGAPP
jgi:hypothetical protein